MRRFAASGRVYSLAAMLVWLVSQPSLAAERDDAQQAIQIPQVHQEVGVVLKEIEQIRLVLGIQPPPERDFVLRDADPRQVFFQGQTLFRKCNTLAQEIAGISRQAPAAAPADNIALTDVQMVVRAAREQLDIVRAALDIDEAVAVPGVNNRSTAGDVMRDIIQAGYVLNELTIRQADWPSIYDRVVQMITYVGGTLPEARRFPALPEYECCKMPEDVYQRLLQQMEGARPLAETVDLIFVRIESRKRPPNGASTGTVYDLTTTMLSDLGELTLRLEGEDIAAPSYPRPARIFPAHVYQLAAVLGEQLAMLGKR